MGECDNKEWYEQMIQNCEYNQDQLTDWELGFVDSVSYRLGLGKCLTERQAKKLEELYARLDPT